MPANISKALDKWRARRNAEVAFRRGNKLYRAGDFKDAVAAYREAVALDPDRPVLRYNLGLALYKAGEKQPARAEWKIVLDLCDGSTRHAYLVEQTEIMLRQFA